MRSLEELNKKLAKWAGFRFRLSASENPHYWQDPSGYAMNELPNFTQSLDACFKWLVPESPKYNPDVRLIQHIDFDYGVCRILDIRGSEYWGESEDPALALCRAVEKLIDGGNHG